MSMNAPVELLVSANRVFSAEPGLDGPGAVAISEGRIVAAGPDAVGRAAQRTIDLGDAVLLPGLVDLHAHPDKRTKNGSRYGVDPDKHLLARGTTTVL